MAPPAWLKSRATQGLQKRQQEVQGQDLVPRERERPIFTSENYQPQIYTPPQTQEQTVEAMPNYDRLTPIEKGIYRFLPGFAESSVGQALERFSESWAGKALSWLDIPAEGLERITGFGAQFLDTLAEPEKNRDFWNNIGAAWHAGSLAADFANLPTFRRDQEGRIMGITVPSDLPGVEGLVEARKKIAAGAPLEQVRAEYYESLGALQLRSQLYDTYFHVLGDPLNVVLPYLKPVEAAQVARIRKVSLGKITDEGIELLRKAQKEAVAIGDVAEAARIAEDLASAKGITRLDRFVIALTGGDPFKPAGKLARFNPLALTPASRAHELLTVVTDNVGTYILSRLDDPAEIVSSIQRAARTGVGPDFGHAFLTLEGRTVQGVLGGFEARAMDLYGAYFKVQDEYTLLRNLAGTLGEDPERFLNMLMGDEVRGAARRLAELGAEVPEDALRNLGKVLNGTPYSPQLFKYQLSNALADHASQQGVLQFGVKARGFLEKMSMTMKAGETMAFLRLNPAYAIRNIVNNEMTMIARGVGGAMNAAEIERFWGKLGFEPIRLGQGFGAIGEAITTPGEVGSKVIQDALRGERGFLDKVQDAIGGIKLGKLDMGQFAAAAERGASRRAFTLGYMQGWRKYYWKPGRGFDRVADVISPAARAAIEGQNPGLLRGLERAIGSAWNEAGIDEFARGNLNLNVGAILEEASRELGYDAAKVLPDDFVAAIEDGLNEAARQGKLAEFMADTRLKLQDHLDELGKNVAEHAARYVENRVAAEGPGAFPRIWGDVMDEFWGAHMSHAAQMEEIATVARYVDDPKLADDLWRKIFSNNEKYWGRQWERLRGQAQGMKQGARKAGITIPDEVIDNFKKIEKTTRDFFKFRNKSLEEFFQARVKRETPRLLWDELQAEIDTQYRDLIQVEDGLTRRIDEIVGRSLPDRRMEDAFLSWRGRARELRRLDKEFVVQFRKEIARLSPRARDEAYAAFWKRRTENWTELWRNERQGLQMLAGDEGAARVYEDIATGELMARVEDYLGTSGKATEESQALSIAFRDGQLSPDEYRARMLELYAGDEESLLGLRPIFGEPEATEIAGELPKFENLPQEVQEAWEINKTRQENVKRLRRLFNETPPAERAEKRLGGQLQDAEKMAKGAGRKLTAVLKENNFTRDDIRKILGEAREATEEVPGVTQKTFIPDFANLQPPEPPVQVAEDQFWLNRGFAALDAVENAAKGQAGKPPLRWANLPKEVQGEIERYLTRVKGQMGDARYASTRFGEFKRDAALLNYNRRFNYNTWLGIALPYEFWLTQSMFKWALHSIDRPAMFTTYLRIKKMLETAGAPNQALPSRLKGNVRISLPFLPEWMGTKLFVDPMRLALPFDTFAFPWEQWQRNQLTVEGRAERVIEDMIGRGQADAAEAEQALQDHAGPLWDQAVAQAKQNDADLRFDAWDFMTLLSSPHAPLQWASEVVQGTPENIGPFTPVTRMSKGISALLGIEQFPLLPHNIEAKVRVTLGLPAFDKWDDYRVDRMLSNMAATLVYPINDIQRAMIEREGPIFEEARRRAGIEFGVGAAGSLLGIPTKGYPTGEFLQRSLTDDFNRAYEAYEAGDVTSLTRFFDKHPEYETRLSLFDEPEERLRNFLVDEIWNKYNEFPDLNRSEIREQLGREFQALFLDKENRSYESIPLDTMQVWLKLLGGDPPGTLNSPAVPLELAPRDVAYRAQVFYDTRDRMFPNWYDEQNNYYLLEKGKARKDYLRNHPAFEIYRNWRWDFLARNPTVAPFLTDSFEEVYESEKDLQKALAGQPAFTWQEWQQVLSMPLQNLMQDYILNDEGLPLSANRELEAIADQLGVDRLELIDRIRDSVEAVQ